MGGWTSPRNPARLFISIPEWEDCRIEKFTIKVGNPYRVSSCCGYEWSGSNDFGTSWIRIQWIWNLLDPDPMNLESPGSGSNEFGTSWIRIQWFWYLLDPDPMNLEPPGSGSNEFGTSWIRIQWIWNLLDPDPMNLEPPGSGSNDFGTSRIRIRSIHELGSNWEFI